jgi:hypothetical protein
MPIDERLFSVKLLINDSISFLDNAKNYSKSGDKKKGWPIPVLSSSLDDYFLKSKSEVFFLDPSGTAGKQAICDLEGRVFNGFSDKQLISAIPDKSIVFTETTIHLYDIMNIGHKYSSLMSSLNEKNIDVYGVKNTRAKEYRIKNPLIDEKFGHKTNTNNSAKQDVADVLSMTLSYFDDDGKLRMDKGFYRLPLERKTTFYKDEVLSEVREEIKSHLVYSRLTNYEDDYKVLEDYLEKNNEKLRDYGYLDSSSYIAAMALFIVREYVKEEKKRKILLATKKNIVQRQMGFSEHGKGNQFRASLFNKNKTSLGYVFVVAGKHTDIPINKIKTTLHKNISHFVVDAVEYYRNII